MCNKGHYCTSHSYPIYVSPMGGDGYLSPIFHMQIQTHVEPSHFGLEQGPCCTYSQLVSRVEAGLQTDQTWFVYLILYLK